MTILTLTEQDGIQLKRVAGTHGGEYAGPCPGCGGRDRFRVWPEEGDGGKWWCRAEDKGGDCIEYLRHFRNMSFRDACSFLKIDPGPMDTASQPARKHEWTPREIISPVNVWVKKFMDFVDWCQVQLWSDSGKDALERLKVERGLSEETIKKFCLGWNPKDLWRDRKAWGAPEEIKENGKPKKLWLPEGIVIPCFFGDELKRVRVKRKDEDKPRFVFIPGSSSIPMIIGDNRKIFIVLESELDAILLHQEIGDMAGVIALGNAQSRPDKVTADLLRSADLILVALDNDEKKEDEGGENTGAKEAWGWWPDHFKRAKRQVPFDGKDPGEMWKNGVDLKMWVEVGIKRYLQPPTDQGHQDEQPPQANDTKLLSSNIEYLDGIDENEDLTGWTMWSRIEHGKEHRFAKDTNGVIRWEQWYLLEPRIMI